MGLEWKDQFTSFDDTRWEKKSKNPHGRSNLQIANSDVSGGKLRIKAPAGTVNGGFVENKKMSSCGEFYCRMKACPAPSSMSAFYLYGPPDFEAEIDIEYYDQTLIFTTYAPGPNGNIIDQGQIDNFDGSTDYHDYQIIYGQSHVAFYLDGELAHYNNVAVPKKSMKISMMMFFPSWLPGTPPAQNQYAYYEEVRSYDVF